MKMGIKEFRERFIEVAEGDEIVVVINRGKRIGRYVPETIRGGKPAEKIDMERWVADIEAFQREWRARTPKWRELSLAAGIPADELDD